jgi:hypothetical protein
MGWEIGAAVAAAPSPLPQAQTADGNVRGENCAALRCAALRCAAVEYPFTYSSGCFARSIRNGLDAKLSALRRRIPAA